MGTKKFTILCLKNTYLNLCLNLGQYSLISMLYLYYFEHHLLVAKVGLSLTWTVGYIVSGSFHRLMKWFVFVHVTVEGYSTPCLGSARTGGFRGSPHNSENPEKRQK